MRKTVLIFAALIIALILLFQISQFAIISGDTSVEVIIAIVAIVFLIIGIYLNKKSLHKEGSNPQEIDHEKIKSLEISKREYEVLQLISEGCSNREIAERLFLSESTIKTHVSSLLVKLNAKRRTQAIQLAKAVNIL